MPALGYHCVFRLADSRAIAPTVAARRALARTLFEIGVPAGLLAFRGSGDHLHAELVGDREAAGAFAQAAGSALKQRLALPVGFLPTHLEPIDDQRHLVRTFAYVLRNAEKHGVVDDPMHEASALPELLGFRVAGSAILPRVRALLPTTNRAQLLEILGVRELEPACVASWLADAAAGAVGIVGLDGRSDLTVRARAAAARVSDGVLDNDVVRDVLAVSERTLRRLRAMPREPALERAIQLRMGLRAALGAGARAPASQAAPHSRGRPPLPM